MMRDLLDLYWLWLFGALSLGIVTGWLTYLLASTRWSARLTHFAIGAVAVGALLMIATVLPARYGYRLEMGFVLAVVSAVGCYLLATPSWNDRPLEIATGAAAIVVLLVIAHVVPARYGYRLELGVILAVVAAIGCFLGRALRDLADFTPSARQPGTAALAAATGSYLFRDPLAGMGAGPAYMRATTGHGGSARVRAPIAHALTRAPSPGGYTFPRTLPFADASASRDPEAPRATGMRRHWTWTA